MVEPMNDNRALIALLFVMIYPMWERSIVMGQSQEPVEDSFHVAEDAPHFLDDRLGISAQAISDFRDSRGYLDSLVSTLRIFYTSTNGSDWNYEECSENSLPWDFTQMPQSIQVLEQWCGLTFSNGVLTRIDLRSMNLTGSLPSEIGDLVDLTFLYLGDNKLTGVIPPELSKLKNLTHLHLSENQLTGVIPLELSKLKNLTELYLSINQLTGPIPLELTNLENLWALSLFDNLLTGPILPEIDKLKNLRYLHVGGPQMTGPIPVELLTLERLISLLVSDIPPDQADLSVIRKLTWIERLDLRRALSSLGEISSELYDMTNLKKLTVIGNQLSGTIPPELGNLVNLESLDLSRNELVGEIPPELDNLVNLESLDLSFNQLTGEIPTELANLVNLEFLVLGRNQLTGSIPPELGRLRNVDGLFLGFNALTGTIPPELGNLNLGEVPWNPRLESTINLAGNQLTGAIPPELGNLVHLQILRLDGNNLTHTIPSTFGDLTNLTRLMLNNNQLTGALPKSLTQIKTLRYLEYGTNSGLCSPSNQAFQTWLTAIPNVMGGTCSVVSLSNEIENQSYPRAHPIPPLVLPTSTTGVPPIQYTLNILDIPLGLQYNASTRTISGTPTQVTPPVRFTYKATDAIQTQDSLQFTIEVYSPVATEQEALPEQFDLQANYPNPFQHATHLVMDLPWTAQIQVEVMDVMGRRVMMLPSVNVGAGWKQTIEIDGAQLPSGLYVYRLIVQAPTGRYTHVSHFTRVR